MPGACGLACKLTRAALSSDAVALRRLPVDRGRELPGGGTRLAERHPGGGRVRSATVSSAHYAPATPVVMPGACGLACKLTRAALSSDAVALRWLPGESAECKEADG
ncbi:UNVERIFIED_CONTAM: hypothetical protein FKN15_001288 [Acipenser sinensis]